MRKQLSIELRRLLKSRSFYVAIFIGLFIAVEQVIVYSIPLYENNMTRDYRSIVDSLPHSVFTSMMGMGNGCFSWHQYTLIYIIPLLVALPFGVSFYRDKKTGYIKNLFTREKKGKYLWSKYIVTFASGGFVAALPVFANYIGNALCLPIITPILGCLNFASPKGFLSHIYFVNPTLYILGLCFKYFVIGGLLATMCLSAAYIVDNIFLVQLFPLVFVTIYNMCLGTFPGLKLKYVSDFLVIEQNVEIPWYASCVLLIFMSVFSFIYFYKSYKEETL